jgi:hypothetical protein
MEINMQLKKRITKVRYHGSKVRYLNNLRGKYVGKRQWRLFAEALARYVQKDSMKAGIFRQYILGK